ncbi:GNAT family N-acetyltransferase [Bacillus sp. BGMRC 2118]|nr:GNAT family N-acetyltransferase [Bacillus sp. BGMRC 2118]
MKENKMSEVFTIDCGEIVLREYSLQDADSIYKIALEEQVTNFLPDWKTSRKQRHEWVKNYEIPGNQKFLQEVFEGKVPTGYLRLGIIHKKTDTFIGWCCLGPKEELSEPNTEIVYSITKEYEGLGFVTLAVQSLIRYIFTKTKIQTINALARIDNIGSVKVIKKCNFTYIADIEIDNHLFHHFKLTKDSLNLY